MISVPSYFSLERASVSKSRASSCLSVQIVFEITLSTSLKKTSTELAVRMNHTDQQANACEVDNSLSFMKRVSIQITTHRRMRAAVPWMSSEDIEFRVLLLSIVFCEMEAVLRSSGLQVKRSIIPDHLEEVISKTGSSIVVWSGDDVGHQDMPDNADKHMNRFHHHAKNVSGLFIDHPDDGIVIRHASHKMRLPVNASTRDLRILPVVTMAELKHDHKSTLVQAERVSSRVSNELTVNVIDSAEEYNNAFLSFKQACEAMFETQDSVLDTMIHEVRTTKDNIKLTVSTKQSASLQKNEAILEVLHSHSQEIRSYAAYLTQITTRMKLIHNELLDISSGK